MCDIGRFLSNRWALAALVFVLVAAGVILIALRVPDPGISAALAHRQPDPARGRYVAVLGDCRGCHTAPDGELLAGGLPFATPVGTVYSTNITPDRKSGIGAYSFMDFARVMRLGVRPDGGRLYPAMPYTSFTKLSDEDLQDLFAYLQQDVAPIGAAPPPNPIRWPLSMRWPLAFWNLAFFDDSRFVADASKDSQWNRGAYVVEALEHCGECHTPRHATLNLDNSKKFAGTVVEGWRAYNITASKQSGLDGWSDDALASYLSTGHADGHSSASGPMAEAIENSLRYVNADDIHAIVVYLRSIPAIENASAIAANPPAATETSPQSSLGEQVFAGNCANCHDWDGKGVQSPYAALLGSRTVNDPDATNLVAILFGGSNARLPIEHAFMPPFARGHSDDELAAVANFVNGYFGDGTANVSAADIEKKRESLHR
jgi:mono/diheme cytochrome c family protein